MEKSVVDDESVWGRGVEGSKISVPWLVTVKVGMREGSGMKRNSIDRSILRPPSLQYYAIFQTQVTDVLSQFFSAIFVSEDEWVVFCVVDVVFDPVSPRVVWIFFIAAAD